MNLLLPILLIILNYLAGSISSAILIAKYVKGVDIRKIGHKKAGGSNVMQYIGIKWGILVGAFDIVKGIPILILAKYLGVDDIWLAFIGTAAVVGHCWPIWFNFSGGRGIATLIGVILFLTPEQAIIPILIFAFSLVPSLLTYKKIIDLKIIGSATLTLLALVVYLILTRQTPDTYDNFLAGLLLFVVLIRRITARIDEYKTSKNPSKLFLSRLLFDNSSAL